ncbi:MAG: ABC transporter substrate-binding protein, partial [Bdellovibrionota bacterium]|nr:ABC transporter substrate-binding protein [Bdellovibrionota bacterium]
MHSILSGALSRKSLIALLAFCCFSLVGCLKKEKASSKDGSKANSKSGVFKINLGQQPTTLNALSSTGYYASQVQSYILESLLERDIESYGWKPSLATKWEVSKDGLNYTFTIREGVKWHDGKPLTIEDVKFSFDAIMDKENRWKTAHSKPYYENIGEAKILDKTRIRFTAKKKYFRNFDVVAG